MPAVTGRARLFAARATCRRGDASASRAVGDCRADRFSRARAFPVHRAFAGVLAASLDPFIHMDHMVRRVRAGRADARRCIRTAASRPSRTNRTAVVPAALARRPAAGLTDGATLG